MTPSRSRFVTACQQLLALAVVLAVLTPAASIVTLDVVGSAPGGPAGATALARPSAQTAAYTAQAVRPSRVPTAPVKADVREVQLTAAVAPAGRAVRTTSAARVVASPTGASRLTTTPQPVTGFGEVGVTWAHGVTLPQSAITVAVRTQGQEGSWSPWRTIPYDPEHGPDPGSAEAEHARPGTEAMLVGKVASVQVRAVSSRPLPADMKLAVIDPGHATHTATERAALDTSTMDGDDGADSVYRTVDPHPVTGDAARLAAAVFTPRPVIYSRAQWGADERIRGKSSLHYGDVHAGFVHHTVNANDYTRAEVPGLLRSIYAYHVKSRGWSDIGYNYLVDRFGRIWEGRYGGIDRAVVGAHTLGYNDDSFAASAIGDYELVRPSQAVVQAYGALFAWKLSLHGVDASSTRQYVTSRWFRAINGHRDAAATACPGQFLYDKLPTIRRLAAADQRGWSGRQLESNLASTPTPDIVVRRADDGEGFVIPTGGLIHFPAPATVASGVSGATGVLVTGDVTGDGRTDLLVRQSDGSVAVRPGAAGGTFGATTRVIAGFVGKDQVSAPGDLNGDGRADLAARNPATGGLVLLLQRADHTFRRVVAGTQWASYNVISAVGDIDGDGHPDLVARDASGTLWRFAGDGHAGFAKAVRVSGGYGAYSTITGGGDFTRDGARDLLVRDRATGATYVVPGHGDGTFGQRLGPFARLASAPAPAVGNVGGNRAPDVVAVVGSTVRAWVNPGTFDLGRPIDTGVSFAGATQILAVGDWDRDGYGDVVTRQTTGNLVLWLGNGHGRLTRAGVLATGFGSVARLAAVGDMTGDGFPDLMGQPRGGVMRIYPGRGAVGLKASYPAYGAIKTGAQIGVGRWNDDGAPDTLIRSGPRLTLYAGNGPGGLSKPTRLPVDLSAYDWVIGVSDLTLTGHPDLLVRQKNTGRLFALQGTPTGFLAPVYLGQGLGGYDLAG